MHIIPDGLLYDYIESKKKVIKLLLRFTEIRINASVSHSNLCSWIRMLNGFLKMRHQDQVASLKPVIVESVVINVRKNRASS